MSRDDKLFREMLSNRGIDWEMLPADAYYQVKSKGSAAFEDWCSDQKIVQNAAKSPKALKKHPTVDELITKNLDMAINLDNVVIDSHSSLKRSSQALLAALWRLAPLMPEGRPNAARGYQIPVKAGQKMIFPKTMLKQAMKVRTFAEVDTAIKDLWNSDVAFVIRSKSGQILYQGKARWLIFHGEGANQMVTLEFNTKIFNLIQQLNCKKNTGFTRYVRPPQAFGFKKKLAYPIYLLALRWRGIERSRRYRVDELKDLMNCSDKKTCHFNSDLLNPAIKEVNHKLRKYLCITLILGKIGKQIFYYQFQIDNFKEVPLESQKDQLDMFPTLQFSAKK